MPSMITPSPAVIIGPENQVKSGGWINARILAMRTQKGNPSVIRSRIFIGGQSPMGTPMGRVNGLHLIKKLVNRYKNPGPHSVLRSMPLQFQWTAGDNYPPNHRPAQENSASL